MSETVLPEALLDRPERTVLLPNDLVAVEGFVESAVAAA